MLRVPSVCFLGALLVSATALRSADQDKWWPDYAGGPASARYFDGEADHQGQRLEARGRLDLSLRRDQLQSARRRTASIYGRGRNGSLVALDAKTGKEIWIHEGMQA